MIDWSSISQKCVFRLPREPAVRWIRSTLSLLLQLDVQHLESIQQRYVPEHDISEREQYTERILRTERSDESAIDSYAYVSHDGDSSWPVEYGSASVGEGEEEFRAGRAR